MSIYLSIKNHLFHTLREAGIAFMIAWLRLSRFIHSAVH